MHRQNDFEEAGEKKIVPFIALGTKLKFYFSVQ